MDFVHTCGPRLHHAARMLTGDTHEAEDLVQNTLTKVFVKWKQVTRAEDPVA